MKYPILLILVNFFIYPLNVFGNFTFYIANNICNNSCDGSSQKPFENFIVASSYISQNINSMNEQNVSIILLNKTNNISDQDLSNSPFSKTNGILNIFMNFSFLNINFYPEGDFGNADLNINSNLFNILITKTLYFRNLNIVFYDLVNNTMQNSFLSFISMNSLLQIENCQIICSTYTFFSSFIGNDMSNSVAENENLKILNATFFNFSINIINLNSFQSFIFLNMIRVYDSSSKSAEDYLIVIKGSLNNISFSSLELYSSIRIIFAQESNSLNLTNILISNSNDNLLNFLRNNTVLIENFTLKDSNKQSRSLIILDDSNNALIFNITSQNTSQIFELNTNNSLIVIYSSFHDLYSIRSGVLVSAKSLNSINLTLNNLNNIKTDDNGGIVNFINEGNTFYFSQNIFSNIYANNSGGVVSSFVRNRIICIENIFYNLTAGIWGGFIVTLWGYLEIKNSYFENIMGGIGVYLYASNSNIFMNNITINSTLSLYYNGTEGYSGGVMYFYNLNNITFNNSIILFSQNADQGGVFHFESSNIFDFNNLFIYNTTAQIQASCGFFHMNNNGTINNLTLILSSSVIGFGLIFETLNNIQVNNSLFRNLFYIGNYSQEFNIDDYYSSSPYGVLVFLYSNNILIENCIFADIIGVGGSTLYLYSNNIVILNNITCNNQININNDAMILSFQDNVINISDSKFSNGIAYNGPAITLYNSTNCTVINSIFENLSNFDILNAIGGCIYLWQFNNITIISSSFSHTSGLCGGCIYLGNDNGAVVYDSIFYNNTGQTESGAIGGWMTNYYFVQNSFFNMSFSLENGGVFSIDIYSVGVFINISTDNSYAEFLGGVFVIMQMDAISIINSTFSFSSARETGGFAHIDFNSNVLIENCSITQSSSIGLGGVIYIKEVVNLTLINNYIAHSIIQGNGAILYAKDNNIIIDNNSYYYGFDIEEDDQTRYLGIISADYNNQFSWSNISMMEIHSVYLGGIFYCELSNSIIINVLILNNISSILIGGFAFFIDMNNIEFNQIIANNISTLEFGGFNYLFFNNTFIMSNSYLSNINTFTNDGGMIYLKDSNNVTLTDLYLNDVLCAGSGGFAYLSSFNYLNGRNINGQNILTEGTGNLLYSDNNNVIFLLNTTIVNEFYERNSASYLIYAGIISNISIEKLNSTMNCYDDGCILYAFRYNFVEIKEGYFTQSFSASDFSLFYFYTDNRYNMSDTTLYLTESVFISAFLSSYQNNSVVLLNNKFTFEFLNYFYQSEYFNHLISYNNFINQYSIIENVYILLDNSTIIINRENISYFINVHYIEADSSTIILRNIDMRNKVYDIVLIDIQYSYFKALSCYFINPFKQKYSLIQANNSKVFLKKIFVFGFMGYANFSTINFLNSITNNKDFNNNFTSKNSIFLNNQGSFGGILKVESYISSNLNVSKDKIQNYVIRRNFIKFNKAIYSGGGIFFSSNQSNLVLKIQNISFDGNQAQKGGSIFIKNSYQVLISGNNFYKSIAKETNSSISNGPFIGGGIFYVDQSHSKLNKLTIQNNDFIQNSANIGGSLYLKTIPITNFRNNFFNNNYVDFYGPDFSSIISQITFINDEYFTDYPIRQLEFYNITSGSYYSNCLFQVGGFDEFGNLAYNNNENLQNLISLTQTNMIDITSHLSQGYLCFDGPFIIENRNLIHNSFSYQITFKDQLFNSLYLTLNFQDCNIGSRLTEDGECVLCDPGTYSLQNNFSQSLMCTPCQDNDPFICEGGDSVHPKDDFWRINKYSDNYIQCLKPGVCYSRDSAEILLTQSSLDDQYYMGYCMKGYAGPLCNVCAYGYGKSDKTSCIECKDKTNWYYFLIIFLKILFKLIYTFYCVYIGFKMMVTIISNKISNELVCAIGLLKILIIHFQILSFLPKLPLQWSANFQTVLPFLFSISPDMSDSFSFECFLKLYDSTLENVYLVLILCPLYITFMFLISLIMVLIKKRKYENVDAISSSQLSLCVLFIIIMITYVDIGKTNLEMFQCINISSKSNSILRLVDDLNIDCDNISHKLWIYAICVPVLVISSLIIILLIGKLFFAYFNKKLNQNDVKFALGYFYFSYKRDLFFWDLIILIRRLLILYTFMFYYEKIFYKDLFPLLLIYFIIINSLLLQGYFNPFSKEYDVLNKAELASLFTLSITYIITIFYSTSFFKNWNFASSYFVLLIIGIILVNCIYFLYWFYLYYYKYLRLKIMKFISNGANQKRNSELSNHDHHTTMISSARLQEYLNINKYVSSYILREQNDINRYLYKDLYEKLNETFRPFEEMQLLDESDNLNEKERRKINNAIFSKKIIKLDKENFKILSETDETSLYDFQNIFQNIIELNYKKNLNGCNHSEYILSDIISITFKKSPNILKSGIFIESKEEDAKPSFHYNIESETRNIDSTIINQYKFNITYKLYNFKIPRAYFYIIDSSETEEVLIFRLPWSSIFFTFPIVISNEIKSHFFKVAIDSLYLYSKIIGFQNKVFNLNKVIKSLFPESIELPKRQKQIKELWGLMSYLPENDCILIYRFTIYKANNSVNLELSSFGENKLENINKYKQICKLLIEDIEFYLNLKI